VTSTITLNPDPPQRGGTTYIGYTGPRPVTLRARVDNGDWVQFTLTEDDDDYPMPIPANASSLRVEDLTGDAPYRDVPCA
jgi:hypothetical protein